MKKIFSRILISIVLFLMSACAASVQTSPQTSSPVSKIVDSVPVSTVTPTPEPTAIPASPTPSGQEDKRCLTIETDPSSLDISGTFVFYGVFSPGEEHPFGPPLLWNLPANRKLLLDDSNGYPELSRSRYLSVSPDRTKLAYYTGKSEDDSVNTRLYILGADGKHSLSISSSSSKWDGLNAWLDNNRLVISSIKLDENVLVPAPASILNPYTREIQELKNDFPDRAKYCNDYAEWGKDYLSLASYNPMLDQVVYPALIDKKYIILWDVKGKREITRLDANGFPSNPVWRADGEYFLINLGIEERFEAEGSRSDELFQVSREGKAERLTRLIDTYAWSEIRSYSWSPNNRYIAFWHNSDKENYDYKLKVLDTETGRIKDWCIQASGFASGQTPFVWSSNGEQLLVYSQINRNTDVSVLIDIPSERAIEIIRNSYPVGWMSDVTVK